MGVRIDEPLNGRGLREAEEFARAIKGKGTFDILLSSPLKRAYQTAEALASALKLSVIPEPLIAERDFGSLSGKTWVEIKEETNGVLTVERLHRELELDFSPWGGETKEDVRERLARFAENVKSKYAGQRVLAVTHAGVLRVLHVLQNRSVGESVPNLSLHEFDV
jgi:probable phosphoglycerate mutase